MQIEISEILSMKPSMEKRIDQELPCSETFTELVNDYKQSSTKINHIILDMQLSDDVLPSSCSNQSTSTAENGEVLWEIINAGLQNVSIDNQDSAGSRKSWSIYRVEQNLKKVHEESTFHPKLVSIGPFHHNKSDHLKPMEQHKWRFLSIFLNNCVMYRRFDDPETRSSNSTSSTTDDDTIIMTKKIQCLVAAMEKLEAGARACYSETFEDLGSKEFVLMMLLDGCFIIQLLLLFQMSGRSCRMFADDLFNKLCKDVVHDVNNCYLSKPLKDAINRIKQLQWGKGGGVVSKEIREKSEITETVIKISHHLQQALTHKSAAAISNYPWTICRAPPKLRRIHEHGFHPTLVAIGPLHRHDIHLKPMEAHKLRFLLRLLENMTLPNPADVQNQNGNLGKAVVEEIVSQQQLSNQTGASSSSSSSWTNGNEKKIEHLVVAMKELEAHTRTCYSETFSESSSEFVMMMIIDSCFVVELLRLYAKWGSEKVVEPIFNTRWMVQSLKHDLIMLENQLPLPVLEKIFNITRLEEDRFTLKDLTLKFFNSLLPRQKAFSGMCTVDSTPNHLLGLFRSSFQVRNPPRVSSIGTDHPSSFRSWVRTLLNRMDFAIKSIKTYLPIRKTVRCEQEPSPPWVHDRKLLIHCVTELKEAGISFKKRENRELLDIEFNNGKLYIPPLLIDDYTGLMFLNFVAYEQCNPWTEPYFTTYLLFLDSLLNSSKDVEHLHSKGIIDHVLGSDEDVAQLFNMLCREVVHDLGDCYLSKVLEDVNQYFGERRHRWRAKWTHDYFSSPWAFISLIAAVVLLILTLIQTFFSVFSYVVPPS